MAKQFWSELTGGKVALRGAKTFTAKAPNGTASELVAENLLRCGLIIVNQGAVDVWLGKDNTVTTSNGLYLKAGATLEDNSSCDAWWAITAGGTAALRIAEAA